ncbi:hypothetical protein C8J57DRAFT_1218180 [Mycena rebaudengoi]|nr:hypothetical protein C8J57DRAFT_1218180 [Mycena rebaudengoi]
MGGLPDDADTNRNALRAWLADGAKDVTFGRWLKKKRWPLTIQSLHTVVDTVNEMGTAGSIPFPEWLDTKLKQETRGARPLHLQYEQYQDQPDVAEKLIWHVWGGNHSRNSSSNSEELTNESKAHILHEAFQSHYQGNAPERFCEMLTRGYISWYNPAIHYGRIIPTIQSSATGKTRLFYEIGEKFIPTFAVCFRQYRGIGDLDPSVGWPYGDTAVAKYFQPQSKFTAEEVAAAFLGQLYLGLSSEAGLGINCFEHLAPSLDMTARHAFLHRVCAAARETLNQTQMRRDGPDSSVWADEVFKQHVEAHADILGHLLYNRSKHIGTTFILVIDECAQLNIAADSASLTYLDALRRVLKAGDEIGASQNFWVVLLDTRGETYSLYPTKERASSTRLAGGTHISLPPWIDLGFNVNMPDTLPSTPNLALSFNWLKKGGRPYWDKLPASTLLSEGAAKLFCGGINSRDKNHIIAAISRRIYLPLSHDSSNTGTHLAGVEKHMRFMTSIGWDDGVVTTAAPSEPILSIAAANTMLSTLPMYKTILTHFLDTVLVNEHMVERGRLGETLASVILTIARDAATCTTANGPFRSNFVTKSNSDLCVSPVTVMGFLSSLLTELPSTFQQAGWVNFTHIDVLPEILLGVINVRLLLYAWCRGVAFHCADNQPIFDLLIPIYLGDLESSFVLDQLSYIVIQVKARVGAAAKSVLAGLTGPIIDTGRKKHKPPYVALLMDLGTSTAFRGSKSTILSVSEAAVPPSKTTSTGVLSSYLADEPLRWAFHARGITDRTYPALSRFGASAMFKVLNNGLQDVVDEEDEEVGREALRTSAIRWSETTATILTSCC